MQLSRTNDRRLPCGAENSVLFLVSNEVAPFTIHLTSKVRSLGDLCDGGTPGYIPNPVVKPVSADGTWSADSWESRSLPRDLSF